MRNYIVVISLSILAGSFGPAPVVSSRMIVNDYLAGLTAAAPGLRPQMTDDAFCGLADQGAMDLFLESSKKELLPRLLTGSALNPFHHNFSPIQKPDFGLNASPVSDLPTPPPRFLA